MSRKNTPKGSDRNRRPGRRVSRRVPTGSGVDPAALGDAPDRPSGTARIVDPIRLVAELQAAIDRRELDDLGAYVASIAVHGLDRVRDRHGVMFAFDLVTELTAVVHRHLTGADVYHVGEDGQIVLLSRRTAARTQAVADEICRSVASRRWDDGTDEIRLPASVGIATVEPGSTPTQVLQAAHDAAAAARGRGAPAPSARSSWSSRSIWTIGGGDLFGGDSESPRRVRGPVADDRRAESPDNLVAPAPRDDIFALVEYRPPNESARLTAAMVLPPQGSAMGVPLLGAPRRREPPKRPVVDASNLVESAEPAPPTHTRATLDAIQASLAMHAAEALHAIEAAVPDYERPEPRDAETPDAAAGVDEPASDETFVLPVRRRTVDRDRPA